MQWTLTRARDILLETRQTWEQIKNEALNPAEITVRYVSVLSVVPAVAFYLRFFFSRGRIWVHFLSTLLFFVLCIAAVHFTARVMHAIAREMEVGGEALDFLKLSAFSFTPVLLGGVFLVFPWLSGLTFIVALYGLYLLYVGIPMLARCPDEKLLNFSVSSMAVLYGAFLVAYVIPRLMMALF
ncbi:MAG: YIP1 family protein [candidate division KSB1 bacterium]|nr:YIP1 family protein [candidate division KSB1 bacterium]